MYDGKSYGEPLCKASDPAALSHGPWFRQSNALHVGGGFWQENNPEPLSFPLATQASVIREGSRETGARRYEPAAIALRFRPLACAAGKWRVLFQIGLSARMESRTFVPVRCKLHTGCRTSAA